MNVPPKVYVGSLAPSGAVKDGIEPLRVGGWVAEPLSYVGASLGRDEGHS